MSTEHRKCCHNLSNMVNSKPYGHRWDVQTNKGQGYLYISLFILLTGAEETFLEHLNE